MQNAIKNCALVQQWEWEFHCCLLIFFRRRRFVVHMAHIKVMREDTAEHFVEKLMTVDDFNWIDRTPTWTSFRLILEVSQLELHRDIRTHQMGNANIKQLKQNWIWLEKARREEWRHIVSVSRLECVGGPWLEWIAWDLLRSKTALKKRNIRFLLGKINVGSFFFWTSHSTHYIIVKLSLINPSNCPV